LKYLLDTHVWIWSALDHPRLSRRTRSALQALTNQERVGVAAISLKEAAWQLSRRRIEIDEDFGSWPLWLRTAASSRYIEVIPISPDVAIESEELGDGFPDDPADQLIAATARVHELTLMTSDRAVRRSGAVKTLW
jgi:PIN domain nuclease of toxin-antitoxin system